MEFVTFLITVILILTVFYLLGTYNHDYFKKRGVPFIPPLPFLGNMGQFVLQKRHIAHIMQDAYDKFPDAKFFGFFNFMRPVYVIKDPEIIKNICIKDLDSFVNRQLGFDEDADTIMAKSLAALHGNKWRNMRAILSPAFTGSKMRLMFSLITDYCDKATDTLKTLLEKDGVQEMEVKELFQKFGSDIIATCSFGIEVNSMEEPNNAFMINGKSLTKLDGWQGFKFLCWNSFPKVMKRLNLPIFDPKTVQFFKDILITTLNFRKKYNFVRHDMVNLLIQARNRELKFDETDEKYSDGGFTTPEQYGLEKIDQDATKWTDDEMVAQCTLFFFAGFDTVSTLTSFMAYELAVNPEVQEKLRMEIDAVESNLEGRELTYDIIQGMQYLDMVVSESLRIWPPASRLDRQCNKAYTLLDHEGNEVVLEPGDGLWTANFGMHRDNKYYPDPEKFVPERFSQENRASIDPATYLMFGIGPRNCIGNRFALMECKAIFFYILSKFYIEMSPKSTHPLQLEPSNVEIAAKNGIWLNFRARR